MVIELGEWTWKVITYWELQQITSLTSTQHVYQANNREEESPRHFDVESKTWTCDPGVHKSTSNRGKLLSYVLQFLLLFSRVVAVASLLFDVMQMCCINWHKLDRSAPGEGFILFHLPCMCYFVFCQCTLVLFYIGSIADLPSGIRETWWRLILGDTALFITGRLPDNNECIYKIVSFTRYVFYPILTKDIYIHLLTLIGRVLCNFCAPHQKTSFCHFAE